MVLLLESRPETDVEVALGLPELEDNLDYQEPTPESESPSTPEPIVFPLPGSIEFRRMCDRIRQRRHRYGQGWLDVCIRSGGLCEVCKSAENLHLHHVCYDPIVLMLLCMWCHDDKHDGHCTNGGRPSQLHIDILWAISTGNPSGYLKIPKNGVHSALV